MSGSTPEGESASPLPAGLTDGGIVPTGGEVAHRLAWSPDGALLACPLDDGRTVLWDAQAGRPWRTLQGSPAAVYAVAWSPDGRLVATGAQVIRVWEVHTGAELVTLRDHDGLVYALSWSADGAVLASAGSDGTVRLWNTGTWAPQFTLKGPRTITAAHWSPDGEQLAVASDEGWLGLVDRTGRSVVNVSTDGDRVTCLAWEPRGGLLATGARTGVVQLWVRDKLSQKRRLESHAREITAVSFSSDGRFLATESQDGSVRVWRTDEWTEVAVRPGPPFDDEVTGLAFHPREPRLAAPTRAAGGVALYDLDPGPLLGGAAAARTVHILTAKVVVVGESGVGKSTLINRLVTGSYIGQQTTHGLRFWTIAAKELGGDAGSAPPDERREVWFWDLGGQDEYKLVHQLFLHDTSLTLVLCELARGRTAFEEAEGWCKRLDRNRGAGRDRRLLVGTKLDDEAAAVNEAEVRRLVNRCKFLGWVQTSAQTSRGLDRLKKSIAKQLDWPGMVKVSRNELRQRVIDEITKAREKETVVLYYLDLEKSVRAATPDDQLMTGAVVRQLAVSGDLVDTQLPTGDRVLVLRIDQVERYACSLVLAARDNPRGLPTLAEREAAAPGMRFPMIRDEDRLPREQEVVVVQCVIELLVRYGICLRQQGLLVFPTLFRSNGEAPRAGTAVHIPYCYTFAGAIDNIYASLVVGLTLSEAFGWPRLWEDRAEFEREGHGLCGVQKVALRSGFARLDIFLGAGPATPTQQLFRDFVGTHLRDSGVDVVDRINLVCPKCGEPFDEDKVQKRIKDEQDFIGCWQCDTRVSIGEVVYKARNPDSPLHATTIALRSKVNQEQENMAQQVKRSFEPKSRTRPLRVLHLSDLHFLADADGEGTDPLDAFHRLAADLKNSDGLGFDELDVAVLSGDFGDRATQTEFERAGQFVRELCKEFKIDGDRCVVVPGNHDLSWAEPVYDFVPNSQAGSLGKDLARHVTLDKGVLVRSDARYADRFNNFSKYFFHPLFHEEYPRDFQDQCQSILHPDLGLQFLALNSAWQVDEYFPHRAAIFPGAVTRGVARAAEEEKAARADGRLAPDAPLLRIAVFHHPVTGNEKIADDAFLEVLRQAGVRLCLHGHVHEERHDLLGYLHPRQVHVAGVGSFGALAWGRPEATPRLYNVLEIDRDHRRVRIHTRHRRRGGGAWGPWPFWPTGKPGGEARAYIDIDLSK